MRIRPRSSTRPHKTAAEGRKPGSGRKNVLGETVSVFARLPKDAVEAMKSKGVPVSETIRNLVAAAGYGQST